MFWATSEVRLGAAKKKSPGARLNGPIIIIELFIKQTNKRNVHFIVASA